MILAQKLIAHKIGLYLPCLLQVKHLGRPPSDHLVRLLAIGTVVQMARFPILTLKVLNF